MENWTSEDPVFDEAPQWALEAVKGFKGHIWAPDIAFYNGAYYLYYSVSAFGKNTSCIGLATNKTLNPEDPDFKWVDHGKVIQSIPEAPPMTETEIEAVLDTVRPFLAVAGGKISIVDMFGVEGLQPKISLKMEGSAAALQSVKLEIMQRIQRHFMRPLSIDWVDP